MLNRVIFKGNVYYKVADLAELFDVSVYKMKKAIKGKEIETTKLGGFGRSVFVLEKNIGAIEVSGEVISIKTNLGTDVIERKTIEKLVKDPLKKTRVKKEKTKTKAKKETGNVVNFRHGKPKTQLEKSHKDLIAKYSAQYLRFHKAQKENIAQEIIEKHLGKGKEFKDAPVDKVETMRLIIEELKLAANKFTV